MVKFKEIIERDPWDDSFGGDLKNPIDPNKEYCCEYCGEDKKEHGWRIRDYKKSHIAFCSLHCSNKYDASMSNKGESTFKDTIYSESSLLLSIYQFIENVQYRSVDPREGNICSALLHQMEEEKLVIIKHNEKDI